MDAHRPQALSSSLSLLHRDAQPRDGDVEHSAERAASNICAYLIGRMGLRCDQVAHNVGLPPLVIEQSIRNGVASVAFCEHLSGWLQENYNVASKMPPSLLSALYEGVAAHTTAVASARLMDMREEISSPSLAAHSSGGAEVSTTSLFAALDPVSREHFANLEATVGHSFVSILNDPETSDTAADWGSWLSGRLYGAFDYNAWAPSNVPNNGGGVNFSIGGTSASLTRPPGVAGAVHHGTSSAELIAENPLRLDLTEYVRLVSTAYNTNRKEVRAFSSAGSGAFAAGRSSDAELPWPTSVPREFFQKTYSARGEVAAFSELLPAAVTPSADNEKNKNQQQQGEEKVVHTGTFKRDLKVLEARTKELRTFESSVEHCLLRHVQSRSEDFFVTSQHFSTLGEEAQRALDDVRSSRDGGVAHGKALVHDYLRIGRLYRRRNHYGDLQKVVTRTQTVLRQVADIENWTALPERDIAELPNLVEKLIDFECFIHITPGSEGGKTKKTPDSWHNMCRLQCLSTLPQRTKRARAQLERLAKTEIISSLSGKSTSSCGEAGVTGACRCAALLGNLESTLRGYRDVAESSLWSATQEMITGFLMSANVLDDAKADALLSISFVSPIPTAEEKKTFMTFGSDCQFSTFIRLFSQLVELLAEQLTQVAQRWGLFLVDSLCKALEMYEEAEETIRDLSFSLFKGICDEAESLLATLLEVRGQFKSIVTNAHEVQQLVWNAYNSISQLKEPLMRLEEGVAQQTSLAGLTVHVGVGRGISVAARQLARGFLRLHHKQHMEKLRVMLDTETWIPMERIDPMFQTHLEELCAADEAAVKHFEAMSLESTDPIQQQQQFLSSGAPEAMTSTSAHAKTAAGSGATEKDSEDAALLSAAANKLYLSLVEDDEGEGRIACNSVLILIELLHSYDSYLARFPSVAFDAVSKIYEVLALYDTNCAALMLGGKAVDKGVLHTITVQHLCAASQCVALVADLVPRMQARLRSVLHASDGSTAASTSPLVSSSKGSGKLLPFINDELARIVISSYAHRNDFFRKMGLLVESKVDSLGIVEAPGQWTSRGNEWVMAMLREVARLMRAIRPLLAPADVYGVVTPLLGSFARKMRRVTRIVPANNTDARAAATSDILLFKANVEKFGYDVLKCAAVESVDAAMQYGNVSTKNEGTEQEEVLEWFFRPLAPASSQLPDA